MSEMSYRPPPKHEGRWRPQSQTNVNLDRKMTEMSSILERWYIQNEAPTVQKCKQPKAANENLGH
jgi:hypothetical protein